MISIVIRTFCFVSPLKDRLGITSYLSVLTINVEVTKVRSRRILGNTLPGKYLLIKIIYVARVMAAAGEGKPLKELLVKPDN